MDMKRYNSLGDYSDDEIFEILQNNDFENYKDLACICSEVLRRILVKERAMKMLKGPYVQYREDILNRDL
jgi:hypothetical protein